MTTNIGREESNIIMLEHLIALDYDAIMTYDAAIARLDRADFKAQLGAFRDDHARHIRELQAVVRDLGGDPPTEADFRGVLAKGRVVLADLAGDAAILKAVRAYEDDTNTAYERAAGRTDVSGYLHELLGRDEDDEHRHRGWLDAALRGL